MMMVPTIFTKDIKEYCEEVKDKIKTSVREDFINEGLAVPTLAVREKIVSLLELNLSGIIMKRILLKNN